MKQRAAIPILALAFALDLALPSRAHAQVNTETLRKRVKLVGYTFILEGSLTADAGNTEGVSGGGGIGGGLGSAPHLVFGYARFDYARYAGVDSVDKTFAHLRYNYEFEDWLWGEVYAQAQSDAFQRLELRNLFGIGPRVRLVHTGDPHDFDLFLGTSYMLERDAISVAPGTSAVGTNAATQVWHRWSTYVAAQWQVDDRVVLAATLYAQPAIDTFANYRILMESVATFKVTKILAASVAGTFHYDSQPPSGVLPADGEIKNTLSLTF